MTNMLLLSRVLQKIKVDPVTGCWVWQGARRGGQRAYDGKGVYGNLWTREGNVYPHRLIAEWWYGDAGEHTDHIVCGNTLCCCPWHLQPATSQANLARRFFLPPMGDDAAMAMGTEDWDAGELDPIW